MNSKKNNCLTFLFVVLLFLNSFYLLAQKESGKITGIIQEQVNGKKQALFGANVFWLGTTIGTITDSLGNFAIEKINTTDQLIISFIGYESDTIPIHDTKKITVTLKPSLTLKEVEVSYKQKTTEISYLDPIKVEKIGEKELLKAACCNLSESFETNPSVDVSFTDAVTGTRQIQLLGLSGPYVQINRENIPSIRGLSTIYGLEFVPGTWISSIQLNKGTGSVVNGFESIAGQINTEIIQPESKDKMYFNLYGNEGGRVEINANLSSEFNKKWSSSLLLHTKNNQTKNDRNNDGFIDNPLTEQYIGLNRWHYSNGNGVKLQTGIKGVYLNNTAGQMDFESDQNNSKDWGNGINVKRLEGWLKVGKVNQEVPFKSSGLQLSAINHDQESYFGLRNYNAKQQSIYANGIHQNIINTTAHSFKVGSSFSYDKYQEHFDTLNFIRTEIVPGVFSEYTYKHLEKWDVVAGLRLDHHNLFGFFFTPRLHLRYAPTETSVFRASAGKGYRTASILAENIGLMASSRSFLINANNPNTPYGLNQEAAWNYGFNVVQNIKYKAREGNISLDLYRTDFINQIVVDLEENTQEVHFYNLDGQSFSNSLQLQIDYELFKSFDARIAYRYYDVKTTYKNVLLDKPLLAKNRAFLNLAYETPKQWKFDITINWQGEKRIPNTAANPEAFRLAQKSPSFTTINAQISKSWNDRFEAYIGVENMFNYRQKDAIINSENPFDPYFDSSLIWGPIFGRNTYIGFRYKIKRA